MLDDNEPQGDDLLLAEGAEDELDAETNDDIVIDGEEDSGEDLTIKKVRDWGRDQARARMAAERRLAELESASEPEIVVGDKPKMEDFDYDADRFEAATDQWYGRKSQAERQKASKDAVQSEASRKVQDLQVSYRTSATRLAPANAAVFDEADKAVREALGDDAPIAMAGYFKEPAKLVIALHKYPSRLQAIADEPDNMKKLLMLKEIEMAIKSSGTQRRAPAPESETIQRGSAPISPRSDKKLEALEAKAAKSGDRSELIAYKASKKAK